MVASFSQWVNVRCIRAWLFPQCILALEMYGWVAVRATKVTSGSKSSDRHQVGRISSFDRISHRQSFEYIEFVLGADLIQASSNIWLRNLVDSGESLYAGLLTEKKSGKTQQKQDYHWISFWPSRKKDSRVDECQQPSVISLLYAEPTHININPDGDLRGTISGESPNSRQWRGLLCYMVRVLLTDEQSAYINFISQPIRSSEWKGRREILYGEKMLLLLLFKMNFPIFTIPFLRLMNIVLVLNLLYVLI